MKQILALLLAFASGAAQAQELLSHGRFSKITMYQPKGTPSSFVIFMSGDGGWNAGVISMAKALTGKGALVAGIDTPAFFRNLETTACSPTAIWKISVTFCRLITS
jgi:type IV secretory pathway VirJ component